MHSVTLNGRSLVPAEVYRDGRVHLSGLSGANSVTVVADCRYTHDVEGLHRSVDPVDGEVYLYTQFEPAHARQVYACFEQPDLKATWQVDGDRAGPLGSHLQHADAGLEPGSAPTPPAGASSRHRCSRPT